MHFSIIYYRTLELELSVLLLGVSKSIRSLCVTFGTTLNSASYYFSEKYEAENLFFVYMFTVYPQSTFRKYQNKNLQLRNLIELIACFAISMRGPLAMFFLLL